MATNEPVRSDLVLVGGGHAHVQVIRRWMMRPLPGVRLTVVLDRPEAVYSGMVPGHVAGDYAAHELEIDVVPLARRARARVVLAPAVRIDPARRQVELDGRPPLAYDVASLDVGSSVRGLSLPGVREFALATRPIRGLVDRLDARLDAALRASAGRPLRLVVVGNGAAGIELAFTVRARVRAAGGAVEIHVLGDAAEGLPGYPPTVARRIRREAERAGIAFRAPARVTGVEAEAVRIGDERLPCDLALWATGAAAPEWLASSPLPLDADGFVRVEETLQVRGHPELFAVGDCASLDAHPWVPKAGVYAVRQGPVLDANLRARLEGRRMRRYRPQRDFLSLLNLGERRALAAKWGAVGVGGWAWRWKDWIDRRFMRRFQVLAADGALAPRFPSPESMGMEEMPCGGCAAKVGASELERALARLGKPPADPSVLLGLDRPDDAAAVALPGGDVLVASIDAFRAFTDDPWLVGRVAAVNAASDVLAKGGRPRHALALVSLPEAGEADTEETLVQVLAGVRSALEPLGATLLGGHTTRGEDLYVGLSVTGDLPGGAGAGLLGLDGLRPGDRLVLTRALGTGVVLAADMQGRAAGRWVRAAHAQMIRANHVAAEVARGAEARACTDVSGFGLAGHLAEMLRASAVSARIDLAAVPRLPGAEALLAAGVRSTFHEQNARGRRGLQLDPALAGAPAVELLFDPQTSGGLVFGVSPDAAEGALDALRAGGDVAAAVIGEVEPARADGALFRVVSGDD